MEHEQKLASRIAEPSLSVVILTYNACQDLALCLTSLLGQSVDMRKVQVVIVDDGSADATASVVAGFAGDLEIDYYVLKHTGVRGGNRNFGVSRARAERLLLLDGDMILSRDFIAGHLRNIEASPETVSMGKRRRPFKADEKRLTPALIRRNFEILENLPALDDERLVYELVLSELGIPHDGVFAMVFSHNLCLWKRHFLAVSGFDERFSRFWGAEDVELGYRLVKAGCRIKLDGSIIGYHLFRNDDVQHKLRQLKKNLVLFREKHRDWEVELAAVEHLIWPFRYLRLREKLKSGAHLTAASGVALEPGKRYLSYGVEFPGARAGSAEAGIEFLWPRATGLFPAEGSGHDVAFVSSRIADLGEEFFERVLRNALAAARRATVIGADGRPSVSYTRESPPPRRKKLIITLSDTNFGGRNKASLYRLGLALSRQGVKVGFALSGDIFENRNKFASFGDLDQPADQRAAVELYRHDMFLDEDVPNLMDGTLGGGQARSVDRRIYWQENFSQAPEQEVVDEAKASYSRIFARRSVDEAHCRAAEAVIPLGVDADGLRRIMAEQGARPPGMPITLLWICPALDDLSNLERVLRAFEAARARGRRLALRLVLGSNAYTDMPEYLNAPSWHMVKKANDHQLEKERRILGHALACLEDRANIACFSGWFGEGFLAREVMKADIVLDTSPGRLLDPWILAAYASNRKLVRPADSDYDDYFDKTRLFEYGYELVSGGLGGLQFEFLAHGALNQSRYSLNKRPLGPSFEAAVEKAVQACEEAGPAGLDESFLARFGWDEVARRFACHL